MEQHRFKLGCSSVGRLVSAMFLVPLLLHPVAPSPKEVAIIVHPANRMSDVTMRDLERLLRLARARWDTGRRVYLVMQEEGSPEKEIILKKVYRMSSDDLKRFWLTKIYRGEMTSFPQTLSSNQSVRRFVSRVPNAIGFIDASFVDESVKAIKVNGKLPGDEGYALGDEVQ